MAPGKLCDSSSQVRLETPFLQVADYASKAPNLSSQDAVKQFYGKQMVFRVFLDLCYKPNAPLKAIKIKVFQNKKEIVPLSTENNPYVPRVDELATLPANGEQVGLEFKSNQIDSSTLRFRIDTLTNGTLRQISTCKPYARTRVKS
jgi:hypothetical protein